MPDKTQLTEPEKLAVVEGALQLLGKSGENWVQKYYFAKRLSTGAVLKTSPRDANCWCLTGALEESAYRLGFSRERRTDSRMARLAGVLDRLRKKQTIMQQLGISPGSLEMLEIETFNDDSRVTFKDVRALLREQLRQLRTATRAQ